MRLNCRALKDMTILWAATTFIFLKTPVNATAATILVAAAVEQRLAVLTQRAGLLFLFIFTRRILLHLLGARMERDEAVLVHAHG